MRNRFWTLPLSSLTSQEWEALCDGCGRCCMLKLESEETGDIGYTNVACRLFDDATCRCGSYETRKTLVPDCVVLSMDNIEAVRHWLPPTCAYKLRAEGEPLYEWHPLISGDPQTVHEPGPSMQHSTIPEYAVDEDDLEDHIIEMKFKEPRP